MKYTKILIFSVLAVFLVIGNAWATPYTPTGTQGDEVQDVLDDITQGGGPSSINVYTDETQDETFTWQSSSANAEYVVQTPYSWAAGDFDFGLYEVGNTSNKLLLFDTSQEYGDPGDNTQIYLSFSNDLVRSYYFDDTNTYQEIASCWGPHRP